MDLELHLATRGMAKRVARARRDARKDLPWADGFPQDGDRRACFAYVSQLPLLGGTNKSSPYGFYLIVLASQVVGGIGFHGPPRNGRVEVGYGVVPSVRKQGVATEALRRTLRVAAGFPGVDTVLGRTTPDNAASQAVMRNAGMEYTGSDADFLHFEIALRRLRT